MSTDTTTQAPSLAERTARIAMLTAIQTRMKERIDAERAATFEAMLAEYEGASGSKSFAARIDGATVAQFTLKESSDTVTVTDEDALVDWLLDNHPSEVETITRPRESFLKVLKKRVQGTDAGVFDPESGEEVPGLTFVKGGQVTNFGTSWKQIGSGDEKVKGQDVALDAVLNGALSDLLALESGEDA